MIGINPKIHDEIDIKIVEIMNKQESKNGVRLIDIAKAIGLTWAGARYRIVDLERQGLLKTRTVHNKFTIYPAEACL